MKYKGDQTYTKLKPWASVIFFLFSAFTISACGSSKAEELNPATLIVDGISVEVPYIMSINDEKISLDEYRFFFHSVKEAIDQGDSAYWEAGDGELKQRELKETTLSSLKATYAIFEMADELQLSLTDDELAQIDSDVKNQISALGGIQKYSEALSEKCLNDTLYRKIWKFNYCRQKVWAYYFDKGGQFYNGDDTISEDEKQTSYNALFQQLVTTVCDNLNIQLQPEYDLIRIDTLQ